MNIFKKLEKSVQGFCTPLCKILAPRLTENTCKARVFGKTDFLSFPYIPVRQIGFIFMRRISVEELSEIINNFGLHLKNAKKDKSSFLCDTDQGLKILSKSADSLAHLQFQHMAKEYLAKQGFPHTDRFSLSFQGTPYAVIDGFCYILTSDVGRRELNVSDTDEVFRAVSQLARFHKAGRGLPACPPDTPDFQKTVCGWEFTEKQQHFMASAKKRAGTQTHKSDFDVLFLKSYPNFHNLLERAYRVLAEADEPSLHRAALENRHLCHHAYKEENLLFTGSVCGISRFSEASLDLQLNDLAYFIRRYANGGDPRLNVLQLEAVYENTLALTAQEHRVLYGLLLYPQNMVRICSAYYTKKRTWIPSAIQKRLEDVVASQPAYEKYIALLADTEYTKNQ